MIELTGGPAPYIYVCTRLRVRKSKLIPREEYLRMLNMSLPEITRVIEETVYKPEIDELGTSFSGIDLIEVALSWNLAKEYQNILAITPGSLQKFTRGYLNRWDIQNVLTILRGKLQGMKTGKIKEVLIPAGTLHRQTLDRMLAEGSVDKIVESLKGHTLYPVLLKHYQEAVQGGSFARLENELYKQFYAELIAQARSGIKGGNLFLDYIGLDIDIKNIKNLFRLRANAFSEDAADMMIPGGSFTVDELSRLNTLESRDEFIDSLKARIRHQSLLQTVLDELRSEHTASEIEVRLTRVQLAQMERMSKLNPFSVHPILTYLEKKKYEVFNLRAIARGKESRLPAERISEYLVI
jgi:V/A-type H+/Na+-transporting ATPase subunit C